MYDRPADGGRYSHALFFHRKAPKKKKYGSQRGAPDLLEKTIDKVAVARLVCGNVADFDVLDLRKRVEDLVVMIRDANT